MMTKKYDVTLADGTMYLNVPADGPMSAIAWVYSRDCTGDQADVVLVKYADGDIFYQLKGVTNV